MDLELQAAPLVHCSASISNGRSEWFWRQLDPATRGAALLDPAVAQHTSFVRLPSAISDAETAVLLAAAEQHIHEHSGESSGSESSHVQGKLYLHHNGVNDETAAIVARIQRLVEATDAVHWEVLSDEEVIAGGAVGPRCVEFREHAPGEGEACYDHYDAGSLFTVNVMLSSGGEFEGGAMQSSAVNARGIRCVTSHTFERGDVLIFLSHKAHRVSPILWGRRRVLIVEFWQGGQCVANHRCCDGGIGRDPLCGLCEGAATYYSRYTRDEGQTSVLAPPSLPAPVPLEPSTSPSADGGRYEWLGGHNYLDGPPFLRCSCPHGLQMLQALYPTAQREAELRSPGLSVWVDWGAMSSAAAAAAAGMCLGMCVLSVRHGGCEVARAKGQYSRPLRVAFPRRDAASPFLAELRWRGGRRSLHVVAPPLGTLHLDSLVLPPRCHPRGLAALHAQLEAAEEAAPRLPPRARQLMRGFGLELEVLTEASAWPLPPWTPPPGDESGGSCSATARAEGSEEDCQRPIRAVLARLASESQALREDGHSAALAPVRAALGRCERWCSGVDVSIQPTPQNLAARMLEATSALAAVDEAERAECDDRCMRMLTHGYGSRRSEFQSPRPPHELRLARGGALEIGCFVHGVIASTGAAAASLSSLCHCAAAAHVHVNVRNPSSGGTLLSAMQICNVVFGWIRFDLVTRTFARPWLWCDPSCVPLYATGAERGTLSHLTWQEVTEADVMADISDPTEGHDGETGEQRARRRLLGDVPAFVHAIHAVVHADDFEALSEAEKVEALFGFGSPGADLGRDCSLNLTAICTLGTLEVRRFHSTLNSTLLVRWAAFCVAFVEVFAATPAGILNQPSSVAALEALQLAQELASSDELSACMAGLVDPTTPSYFQRDAVGTSHDLD